MNLKFLAVITDVIDVDTNKADEIVGFEDWKDARDHGDLIGDTIESGLSNNRRHTYAIWEYDPDGEGGDRFYWTTTRKKKN